MYDLRTTMAMSGGRAHALTRAEVKAWHGSECVKVTRAANNSWRVDLEHGGVAFVHIRTEVVRVMPGGTVILNSGGWHTMTTKGRLNRFQGLGAVYSRRGQWKVATSREPDGVPFVDGMRIRPDGVVIYKEG